MKLVSTNGFIMIEFDDGKIFSELFSQELWNTITSLMGDEKVLEEKLLHVTKETPITDRLVHSKVLTVRGNSIYMPSVSELTVPQDLAEKILYAEETDDSEEVQKYVNFWTLVSLNPDSRVRDNIFWFIKKWDIKLTQSGLIVAYRNADILHDAKYSKEEVKNIINSYYKEKYINHRDPKLIIFQTETEITNLEKAYNDIVNGEGSPVFTDQHSHTTRIKLGQPVRMPREETDSCQENTCSRGLHVASAGWLQNNYFGDTGLQVLVNPSKVVAVPPRDSYGKMRTCEYFPVAIIDYDDDGNVIESPISLYNDIECLKTEVKYDGEINNEDCDNYEFKVTHHLSREEMYNNILETLHEC